MPQPRKSFVSRDGAAYTFPPAQPMDDTATAALPGEIPTLLLAGELDPITPAHWAQALAESSPHSQLVVLPARGIPSSAATTAYTDISMIFWTSRINRGSPSVANLNRGKRSTSSARHSRHPRVGGDPETTVTDGAHR